MPSGNESLDQPSDEETIIHQSFKLLAEDMDQTEQSEILFANESTVVVSSPSSAAKDLSVIHKNHSIAIFSFTYLW